LREVHDGKWNRSVGADGGQTISWEGRIVLVCACTTAWDTAYSVVAQMGPRFITIRSSARDGREAAGERSITNTGFESTIRSKITKIVTALINDAQLDEDEAELKKDERKKLVAAADLVTLARTAVEVDFQGNVIDAHEPEMPTRFVKQLVLIFRGALSIGIERKSALALALRCARDSIPPIRLLVLKDLDDENNTLEDCRVTDIAKRLYKPWTTIKRTLEALYVLRLVNRVEVDAKDDGSDDKADYAADDKSERKHTKKAKPKIMHYVLATNIKLTALDPGP
jgi:hypothetical protein